MASSALENTAWLARLALGSILTFSPLVTVAQENGSKGAQKGAETTIVRVNITTVTPARQPIVINGKRIANYQPKIIHFFPSTGVVFDDDGHVLTFLGYRWVDIQASNPRIDIITSEGQKHRGKLLGIDQSMGVAVVLSLGDKLERTPLCERCEIKDGTTVVAPVPTTPGIRVFKSAEILSVGPPRESEGRAEWVMTIRGPLPGVGEPLLNVERRVLGFVASQRPSLNDPVGPNTIVYPISQLLSSAEKILQTGGNIRTGWLGVFLTDSGGPAGSGIVIKRVQEESPAQKAGLAPDDVLVKWNGKEIRDARQFIQWVQDTQVGSKVALDVLRQGKPISIATLIEARRQEKSPRRFLFSFPGFAALPDSEIPPETDLRSEIGIDTVPLNPQIAEVMQIREQPGLLVVKVDGTVFSKAGVLAGDVILSVDGQQIADSQSLLSRVRSRDGNPLTLRLLRKGAERSVTVELPQPPPIPTRSRRP